MTLAVVEKAEVRRIHPVCVELGERFGITADAVVPLLLSTCIAGTNNYKPTPADAYAFSVVAKQYNLNPFTKEIHAFCDGRRIVPIVGVDGWARIVNSFDQYNGCDFEYHEANGKLSAITCSMYVKGREHPTRVTEYMDECKRSTTPWGQMPRRMLRHKAFMQAARYAFSIAGIYDPEEANDIISNDEPPDPRPIERRVLDKITESMPDALPEPPPVSADTTDVEANHPAPPVGSEGEPQPDPWHTLDSLKAAVDEIAQERGYGPEVVEGCWRLAGFKQKAQKWTEAERKGLYTAAKTGRGFFAALDVKETANA